MIQPSSVVQVVDLLPTLAGGLFADAGGPGGLIVAQQALWE
ncbi:hypothetical protein ABZ912_55165 [Nonomuraea angiospora]